MESQWSKYKSCMLHIYVSKKKRNRYSVLIRLPEFWRLPRNMGETLRWPNFWHNLYINKSYLSLTSSPYSNVVSSLFFFIKIQKRKSDIPFTIKIFKLLFITQNIKLLISKFCRNVSKGNNEGQISVFIILEYSEEHFALLTSLVLGFLLLHFLLKFLSQFWLLCFCCLFQKCWYSPKYPLPVIFSPLLYHSIKHKSL